MTGLPSGCRFDGELTARRCDSVRATTVTSLPVHSEILEGIKQKVRSHEVYPFALGKRNTVLAVLETWYRR